jgi:glutamyl-Q tRNA(Asp) synthetase
MPDLRAATAEPASGGTGRGPYVGRFAPSPTGPLHAGSLVAALASWLDARAHGGQWLVRIEDVDGPRCVPGADAEILRQLDALGLRPDAPPLWQSRRGARYQAALDRLVAQGDAYPCGCTRSDIARALAAAGHPHERHHEWVYPGTCRLGLQGKPARAWRVRTGSPAQPVVIDWHDRRLGPQRQDVTQAVGDFVVKRADGLWAYQLAVVVDDADQGVTDVVRGEDLADNTARQIHLQRLLGLPMPRYLHTPLVLDARGEKLSKQHGAPPVDTARPVAALQGAAQALGLPPGHDTATPADWLAAAVPTWGAIWGGRHTAEPMA